MVKVKITCRACGESYFLTNSKNYGEHGNMYDFPPQCINCFSTRLTKKYITPKAKPRKK